MKTGESIYLAREGKTFGPFSESDIDRLRKSGKIHEYHWMWIDAQGKWEAVDSKPVGPPARPDGVPVGTAFIATRALIMFGKGGEAGMHQATLLSKGALGCELDLGPLAHKLPIRSRAIHVQLIDSKGTFRTYGASVIEAKGSCLVLEWVGGPKATSRAA